MNKKLAIILIVAAFIIGAIGGGWSVGYFRDHLTMRLITKTETAETSMDVVLLKRLRANNVTNVIDLLETQLDGAIGMLGFYVNNVPKANRDPQDLKTLQIAKEYREQFPHQNSGYPEINQMVSNAFLIVSVETNK